MPSAGNSEASIDPVHLIPQWTRSVIPGQSELSRAKALPCALRVDVRQETASEPE
jgi:hypothetical protein